MNIKFLPLLIVVGCGLASEPVTTIPKGAYTVAYLTLSADADKVSMPVFLSFRDGVNVSTRVANLMVLPGVKIEGSSLYGNIKGAPPRVDSCSLSLTGTITGDFISGTWEGSIRKGSDQKSMSYKGTLTGKYLAQAALATSNAVNPAANWNSRYGSGPETLVAQAGPALADKTEKFQLAWKSEEPMPGQPGWSGGLTRKAGSVPLYPITGGGASPAVAEGRVVIRYHLPAGDIYDKAALGVLTAALGPDFPQKDKIKVVADEVILCMDVATGATVWKTVIPLSNMNYQEHKMSPNDLSPAISGGRVFAVSPSMIMRCLSLADGKILWQAELPKAPLMAKNLASAIEKSQYMFGLSSNRDYGFHPVIAGDLVVTNSWGADLLAFKISDGTLVWTAKNVCDAWADPLIWKSEGVEFAFIGDGSNMNAVKLTDGTVAWKLPVQFSGFSGTPVVSGDKLVAWSLSPAVAAKRAQKKTGDTTKEKPAAGDDLDKEEVSNNELVCFAMTKEGGKKIWVNEGNGANWDGAALVVVKDRVYVGGRGLASAIDLNTGKVVAEAPGETIGNCGHFFAVGDRLFANGDGKHGEIHMAMFDIKDGIHRMSAPNEVWYPSMPPSTSYHHWATYPIVDGRMFIRGGDGVYCWDMRKN